MPYLQTTELDGAARKLAMQRAPFGPGLTEEQAKGVTKVEVWCSSFNDPGPDYTDFKFFDQAGKLVGTRTLGGY